MADELIGKQVGGYEILNVIGHGGMATVYRAQQVSMKRIVALKVLPRQYANDNTYMQRFLREVEIVARLEHRNIVPVHDFGEFDGLPYIVMRYMGGGSVDDLLRSGPIALERIYDILEQIAPALDYAHSKDVLHRDLKPSNVLLDENGGAYLTDFGIARIVGEQPGNTITTQGVVGTPSYMSPEQAQGHPLDNRSDVYSLGVMLFEMATGRRPFQSDTPYSIAVMQVTTPPPSPRTYNPAIPMPVEQVIYRSLKKQRDDRYASAAALVESLRVSLDGPNSSVQDTQPGLPKPQNPPTVSRQVAPPPQVPRATYVPTPPTPQHSKPVAPVRPMRRPPARKKRPNLWMSAAIGGLIGCGLLTVLVILLALAFNMVPAASGTPEQSEAEAVGPTPAPDSTVAPSDDAASAPTDLPAITLPTIAGVDTSNVDGELVFFANRDGNIDLYRLNLADGVETRLTTHGGEDSYPSVSPDGRYIAFQSNRDGDFDIYVMDVNCERLPGSCETNTRQVTDNGVTDSTPAWSPDGDWIIFASDVRGDDSYDIYRARPDGSDLEVVFSGDQRSGHPRQSAGGLLVFTYGNSDNQRLWDIGRYDLRSGEFVRLNEGNDVKEWSPTFAPDGQSILFLRDGQGSAAIARMGINGENPQTIFDGPGYEWGALYSPDGQYISYTSDAAGGNQLYIMTADGRGSRRVTTEGGSYGWWIP